MQNDPYYKADHKLMEKEWSLWQKSRASMRIIEEGKDTLYEIPVVFHVIHSGEPIGSVNNPSDGQIISLLDYVNQTFAGAWQDYLPLESGGVNIPIRFRLAVIDPSCRPTNGIIRVDGRVLPWYQQDGISYDTEKEVKDLSKWPTDKYYNVWLANKVFNGGGGFAHLPWDGLYNPYDGVVISMSFAVAGSATMIHEVGHGMGLHHTFEGSHFENGVNYCPIENDCLTAGDNICDTEPHLQVVTCEESFNVCTGNPMGKTPRSFMSYSMGCQDRFTKGQKERVMFSVLKGRQSLLKSLTAFPCRDEGTPFIKVYPNPVSEILNVSYHGSGIFCIQDLLGRNVLRRPFYEGFNALKLDVSTLNAGVYVYTYYAMNGRTEVGKLSIVR
jgi:hypothetical protein